jgi:hypothetical protein
MWISRLNHAVLKTEAQRKVPSADRLAQAGGATKMRKLVGCAISLMPYHHELRGLQLGKLVVVDWNVCVRQPSGMGPCPGRSLRKLQPRYRRGTGARDHSLKSNHGPRALVSELHSPCWRNLVCLHVSFLPGQEFLPSTAERYIQVSKNVVLDYTRVRHQRPGRLLIQSFTGAGLPHLLNEK